MLDVSIIIVNYKTANLIIDAIKSILYYEKNIDFEIIVVDNNSEDGIKKLMLDNFSLDKRIKLLELNANLGFGLANNVGIDHSVGRNVLFLNPDTCLLNNAIEILSSFLDNNIDVAACGGNLFDEFMNPAHSYKLMIPSISNEVDKLCYRIPSKLLLGKNKEFNYTGKPLKVKYITGADLMIKKKVLDEVGAFSPDFFMYFEETELCFRLMKRKYSIYSVPDAEIQHLEGKSFFDGKKERRRFELSATSEKVYITKCYSKQYRFVAHLLNLLNLCMKIFVSKLIRRKQTFYLDEYFLRKNIWL